MSEPDKKGDIPDESAGKGIPNGGNAAKSKEVRVKSARSQLMLLHKLNRCET